jgi:hypothetical protein
MVSIHAVTGRLRRKPSILMNFQRFTNAAQVEGSSLWVRFPLLRYPHDARQA